MFSVSYSMNQQNPYDESCGELSSYDDFGDSSGDFVCWLSPDAKYPRIKVVYSISVYGLKKDGID